MNGRFRDSMTWLHTWSGLVMGWLLFAIFLTGTAAVFRNEITIWMTPEAGPGGDRVRAIELAVARLQEVAPDAESWTITPPDDRRRTTEISWTPARTTVTGGSRSRRQEEQLDATTGQPLQVRQTEGGDFFYHFHYRLEQPDRRGWWLSGAAAMVMLVALTSGVIIHRRFFKEFFTFRPRARTQRSWLDAHTVAGVLALPFHVMITYTGLVPIMSTVMPAPIVANYREGRSVWHAAADYDDMRSTFLDERRLISLATEPAGVRQTLVPMRQVIEQTTARWDHGRIGRVTVRDPGDRNALIEVTRHVGDQLSNAPQRLLFEGTSGRLMASVDQAGRRGPALATFSVMYGLHMARFADTTLRWVYFVLGLASTTMIGTGLIFWTVKRRTKYAAHESVPFGHELVERLNVGFIAGLPVAIASFFWANRVLAADMLGRAAMERRVFYLVWGSMLIFASVRPAKRGWSEVLGLAVVAFAAIPVLNALTTKRHLVASCVRQDWTMVGFDLTMVVIAGLLGAAAWKTAPATRSVTDAAAAARPAATARAEEGVV